jgi:hypothetical protein
MSDTPEIAFSLHQGVGAADAERLWPLYEASLGPLAARAAFWQVYSHEQFLAMLADPRIDTHVGHEPDGALVAVGIATRHVDAFPWLSKPWFAARWPEEYLEQRIYVIGFTAIRQDRQQRGYHAQMVAVAARIAVATRSVIAMDVCAYNEGLGIMPSIQQAASAVAPAVLERVDTQAVYALTFDPSGSGPTSAAGAGRP